MKTCSKLLMRFKGVGKHTAILEELRKQTILNDCSDAIDKLARVGEALEFKPGQKLITQGDASQDIFFIFCGEVAAQRNNREFTRRRSGQAVGELTLIDRTERRSATIVAVAPTVAFRIKEADFSRIAAKAPQLWRSLAIDCARRLRERLQGVRMKNRVPIVFIGSSKESLRIAKTVSGLLRRVAKVRLWSDDVFTIDQLTLEALEKQTREVDYAVLVWTPDDRVKSRSKSSPAPRDNVVLELGMFIGALGHKRSFLLKPRNSKLKIPSDLLGKNHLDFRPGTGKALRDELRQICQPLVSCIKQHGAI